MFLGGRVVRLEELELVDGGVLILEELGLDSFLTDLVGFAFGLEVANAAVQKGDDLLVGPPLGLAELVRVQSRLQRLFGVAELGGEEVLDAFRAFQGLMADERVLDAKHARERKVRSFVPCRLASLASLSRVSLSLRLSLSRSARVVSRPGAP